jgi:hypothetical protein
MNLVINAGQNPKTEDFGIDQTVYSQFSIMIALQIGIKTLIHL